MKQKIRRMMICVSFMLFPLTLNYFSPLDRHFAYYREKQ